ncbi:hypothetical protein ABT390_24325 [Streptomyces aurantiacus]|uniref:Uncharacterized protein n=1 Tax=Streptomyces aurantiacus JA 4570 TaxID=1286094 RepID=S3ZPW3_9ACTN|nr:hypothetical protein [Streptomyces aurantiacus]EPH45516.1 hypothetical protein STRAU_1421 [Streptomyces aurantiacus JA 4570]
MTPAELLDKQDLIKRLQDLAGRPALAPRAAELNALTDDLTHSKRLDRWAELDLVHAYVRPESVTTADTRPSARRDGLLEAALGVLVFIPLLITWFGLRDAVRAYGELAKDDRKEATRPFLQLWQSGFGGHLSPLGRFENVALTAVVLIALLVLLSVVHARVRWRADREEADQEAERERLLAQLASVLTRLQMLLAPHRSASPKQFAAELTKAATKMNSLATQAEKNHKALSGTAGAVTDATTSLRDATARLATELPKLSGAADRIETAVRESRQATAHASSAYATTTQVVADALQELVARSESVVRATEQASQALVASTGRTTDAVDGMRAATERWDAAAAHWQDAAARVESGVRTLAGAPGHNGTPHPAPGTQVPGTREYEPGVTAYGAQATEPYETQATEPYGTPVPSPGSTNGTHIPDPRAEGSDHLPAYEPADAVPQDYAGHDAGPDAAPDPGSDVGSPRTRALRPPSRRPSAPPRPGGDT